MPEQPLPHQILVVDDDEAILRGVARTLRAHGLDDVVVTNDSRSVPQRIREHPPAVLLLDLVMPDLGGREILELVRASNPDVLVIIATAEQDVRTAVDCMKAGAYDYLLKPTSPDQLVATVRRALEHRELEDENAHLRARLLDREPTRSPAFDGIVTMDAAMEKIFAYLEVVAPGSQPLLIAGETGTGKDLLARAVHRASGRKGPFVAVNVAGLDDSMFSDTLFGHRAGAFTGAIANRAGMVEQAAAGTLFLDEIGDLAESSQVKLLRLLQEREYFPLGADAPRRMEARVVAATHQQPQKLRQDLFYRLRSYRIEIPPLRERRGDIALLAERFADEAAKDLGRPAPTVPPETLRRLESHGFPGNVRELRALVFDAVARSPSSVLGPDAFPDIGPPPAHSASAPSSLDRLLAAGDVVPVADWNRLERQNMVNALSRCGWKISGKGGAATLLGLSPSTLESRMKALAIERPRA